jgi:hypothetical protein
VESLAAEPLPEGALVLVDSAPIIYTLEAHPRHALLFLPLFAAQQDGRRSWRDAADTTPSGSTISGGPFFDGRLVKRLLNLQSTFDLARTAKKRRAA